MVRSQIRNFAACSLLLIVAVTAPAPAPAQDAQPPTRATTAGPEYQAQAVSTARLWQEGDPGERLHLRGRVVSTAGEPLSGVEILLWQADGSGHYHDQRYRAQLFTGEGGEFRLTTAVPGSYYAARHIHVMVSHPNYQPLTSRILFKGDPRLSPADEDLAILLEEVQTEGRTVKVGNVQFVLAPM